MYKIALCGKANSGKNTAANLITASLVDDHSTWYSRTMAFADPIKEMIEIMFPHVKKKNLYGSSALRNTVIQGAVDKKGQPLTIRQALIEIGTGMGRAMNDSIWLDVFDHRYAKYAKKNDAIIVTDVRFPNEFKHLKDKGFIMVKILRDGPKLNDLTETTQDSIPLSDFHWVLRNEGTLEELEDQIRNGLTPLIAGLQTID